MPDSITEKLVLWSRKIGFQDNGSPGMMNICFTDPPVILYIYCQKAGTISLVVVSNAERGNVSVQVRMSSISEVVAVYIFISANIINLTFSVTT